MTSTVIILSGLAIAATLSMTPAPRANAIPLVASVNTTAFYTAPMNGKKQVAKAAKPRRLPRR